jgi:hypothetical protein
VLAAFHGGCCSRAGLIISSKWRTSGGAPNESTASPPGSGRPVGGTHLVLVESAAETPGKTLEPLRAACDLRCLATPPVRATLLAWARHA